MTKHYKYSVRQIENVAENGFLEVPFWCSENEQWAHYITFEFSVKWCAAPLHWAHFVAFFDRVLPYHLIIKELMRIFRRKKWQTSVLGSSLVKLGSLRGLRRRIPQFLREFGDDSVVLAHVVFVSAQIVSLLS